MTAVAITTLQQTIFTDYYVETREVAERTCRAFRSKFGGDLEEYISHTNEILTMCFIRYQAGTTPTDDLIVEVKRWVWYNLFDKLRKEQRWRTKQPIRTTAVDPEMLSWVASREEPDFDLDAIRGDLSVDACTALDLVLDGVARSAAGLRQALTRRGWGITQITEVFAEISGVL